MKIATIGIDLANEISAVQGVNAFDQFDTRQIETAVHRANHQVKPSQH